MLEFFFKIHDKSGICRSIKFLCGEDSGFCDSVSVLKYKLETGSCSDIVLDMEWGEGEEKEEGEGRGREAKFPQEFG